MKKLLVFYGICQMLLSFSVSAQEFVPNAPLYRDPITDGAADPVLVYNREEESWWMLYTQRRANVETADVAYCYGNDIGIASSKDNGKTWVYRGTLDLEFERGKNTFWAPDVVYLNGTYHMFVAYIQGVRNHWGGHATLVHYTSQNLWDWKHEGYVDLDTKNVIDATLIQLPDGLWKMWYKSPEGGGITMSATSKDLFTWKTNKKPAIGGQAHEGPKAFWFKDSYWVVTDEWQGLRVYKSDDTEKWEKQDLILDEASSRFMDGPKGAHGDVVVTGDKAYVIYFTHPGRKSHLEAPADEYGNIPLDLRRSVIQVRELIVENGKLIDKADDFTFYLPNLK